MPYFQFLKEEAPFLFPNKDFAGFWTEPQTLMAMGSRYKLQYEEGRVGTREEWDLLCSLFGQLVLHFISPGEKIPCHSTAGAGHHWQAVVRKLGFNSLAPEFPIRRKKALLSSKQKLLQERLGKGTCMLVHSTVRRSRKPSLASFRGMHGHILCLRLTSANRLKEVGVFSCFVLGILFLWGFF